MTAPMPCAPAAEAVAAVVGEHVDLTHAVRGGSFLGLVAAGLAAAAVLVLLGGRRDTTSGAADEPLTGPVAASGPPTEPVSSDGTARTSWAASAGSTGSTGSTGSVGANRGSASRARLRRREHDGGHATDPEVSSALALLALAYRSGLPTWDVLEAVASGLTGRASTDLRQVAAALRWGASESDAWASVGPTWSPAARAVAIAQQAGVPPGAMLLAASDDLHAAELERLEVSAAKVGVRLVAPLGLVLLPAFCLTTVAPLVIALAGDLLTT